LVRASAFGRTFSLLVKLIFIAKPLLVGGGSASSDDATLTSFETPHLYREFSDRTTGAIVLPE
jgi:hypothetical protein